MKHPEREREKREREKRERERAREGGREIDGWMGGWIDRQTDR